MAEVVATEVPTNEPIEHKVEFAEGESISGKIEAHSPLYHYFGIDSETVTDEVKNKLAYIWDYAVSQAKNKDSEIDPVWQIQDIKRRIGATSIDEKSYNQIYGYIKLLKQNNSGTFADRFNNNIFITTGTRNILEI